MANATELKVQEREGTGKGFSRALRRTGRVPAVLYGGAEEPVHFSLDPVQLEKELHKTGFMSKVFELAYDGKKHRALAKAVQFHPVTDQPLHVDFFRVVKGAKVTVAVPLTFTNELASPGLKKGGVLNIVVHNLEVTADVDKIPQEIQVDLTGLVIHDTIHLTDLKLPEGIEATHPERDNDIANIVAPTIMKQTEEAAEGEAAEGQEGEAASEEEKSEG